MDSVGQQKQKKIGNKRQSSESKEGNLLRKKSRFSTSRDDGLSAKQRMRIVSKAIVSDSSDSSSSGEEDEH